MIECVALFLTFWPKNDLSSTIESLKSAPERLTCSRETPTSISLDYYADGKAGWQAVFAGKDHKDFLAAFIIAFKDYPQGKMAEFVFVNEEWIPAGTLTPEENAEFRKKYTYSEEENKFLGSCINQIAEYIQKREERKKLYTPVLGVF